MHFIITLSLCILKLDCRLVHYVMSHFERMAISQLFTPSPNFHETEVLQHNRKLDGWKTLEHKNYLDRMFNDDFWLGLQQLDRMFVVF